MSAREHRCTAVTGFLALAAAALLAWTGMLVHNMADLPLAWTSPENMVPAVIWLVLLAAWAAARGAGWASALLLVWGTINLIGAVVTVLPLEILPFAPEQSVRHYAFHGLYVATQLPLLMLALKWTRATAAARAPLSEDPS